jgi:putative restriction endonuclease
MVDEPRAWVLLTVGDQRQYGGNLGYEEDPATEYRYDSFVQFHRQVNAGDTVILRDRATILGSAIIESIDEEPAVKTRLACPMCDTTGIKERRTLTPRFRCRLGHVFEQPGSTGVNCTAYTAGFARTFVPARDLLAPTVLRAAELHSSDQLSIRLIDIARLTSETREILGWEPASVPRRRSRTWRTPGAAGGQPAPFTPTGSDIRTRILRQIRARQGQARFRAALRSRYGDACMITGCAAMEAVEAAHISPYRGPADNHPENGLLLRADLHTLFDLDLLAVDPGTLRIQIAESVRGFGYEAIHGHQLNVGATPGPSRSALRDRWDRYSPI